MAVDCSASDDQVACLLQQFVFFAYGKRIEYLHRNQGRERRSFRQIFERMSAGVYRNQVQSGNKCADHDHFACDILQRHAEERCVMRLEPEK